MPIQKALKLNTGASMPVIGLGTWKSRPGEVGHAVEYAIREVGYRHVTATGYANEKEVGSGIKASGVPREQIFVVTKSVKQSLEYSLSQLGTGWIDLWLMHWPAPMIHGKADKNHDWLTTWKDMVEVFKHNPTKLKAIGVSNFSAPFLKRLLENTDVVPAVNQVELHPALPQNEIRELCQKHGIVLTAYSPLGSDNSPLLEEPSVLQIAQKYGVPLATILISYQANLPNTIVIPKSVTNSRIRSNFQLLELTPEEIKELTAIAETQTFRACGPKWTGWGTLGFPDVSP